MFFQKIGQEIWEQGELSPGSKAILRSISVQDIRRYREQFQQMASQQLRQRVNTPVEWELLDAAVNCGQAFSNDSDRFIKDYLDILCNNKGNAIINKLLARFSQYIKNYVIVEDTGEIDEATYQQMRSGFEQIIFYIQKQLANRGFTEMDKEKGKEVLRNLSVEDIRAIRETLRKFSLKAIDTEAEIYNQIPVTWRAEVKHFLKSAVNLLAGMLDENLIYDCLQIGINESLSSEEIQNRIFKRITQQLNQWAMKKRFYVKSASSATINKILPITQQITAQMNIDNDNNNHQVQQLQEQINKLCQEIQDLKAERERERKREPASNFRDTTEIERRQKELERKQSQLEKLQRQEGSDKKPMKFSLGFGDPVAQEGLNQFAKKMEKFDNQQPPEGKLSGGNVALIVCACLVGAGLIGFLLWLALRKKKH